LSAGRILVLRGEVRRLGGDVEIGLRAMGIEPGPTDTTATEEQPS
jgi:hypothetical protein